MASAVLGRLLHQPRLLRDGHLQPDQRTADPDRHVADLAGGQPDARCSHKWPLHLYDIGRGAQVDSSTTWSGGQPSLPSSAYKTDQLAPGPPYCTNNRDVTFGVWDPIVSAKNNNREYWAIALTGEECGGFNGSCDPTNSRENCGQVRICDEIGDDSGSTEFPYVVITFDIIPPQPQEPSGGDTSSDHADQQVAID